MKTYKGYISNLPYNGIFVFGSNTEGRHSKGAAKVARDWFGAEYGNPKGRQGKSYAIITKDLRKPVHPSISEFEIYNQITDLYLYAMRHPELYFYIVYSGTGNNLNGYTNQQMANLFSKGGNIPENIIFEEEFSKLLNNE